MHIVLRSPQRYLAITALAVAVAVFVPAVAVAASADEPDQEEIQQRLEEYADDPEAAAEDLERLQQQAEETQRQIDRARETAEEAKDTAERVQEGVDRARDAADPDSLAEQWDDAVNRVKEGDVDDLRPNNRVIALVAGLVWLWIAWRTRRPRLRS